MACALAATLLVVGARPAEAQRADTGVGRSPRAYAYGGLGVLGHVRIESAFGLPSIQDVSTTGRIGIDFPVLRNFALGAQLRGLIIRGLPGYDVSIGDVSFVPRWRFPLAGGRASFDIGGLLGPTAAMFSIAHEASPTSDANVATHNMIGFHGGGVLGIVTHIAEKLSCGVHLGYVHQVLFAPPAAARASPREIEPMLHVDQLYLETELVFEL